MDTEAQQNALKMLDTKLRQIRRETPSEAARCTDVLRNINYAVNTE